MAKRLPPLNALRTFEVAARHLSLTRAAEELHVTPAAVSHQIRALEDHLGVELFTRLNRGLELTAVGQSVLPKIQEGFECLGEAVKRAREHDTENALTVFSTPSLAAKWLVPRLHHFTDRYPGIDLRITASAQMVDPQPTPGTLADELRHLGIDLAILFGGNEHPGCHVAELFAVSVVPLCSPRLLEGKHPLRQPDDLRYHTLIHDDTVYEGRPDWSSWLKLKAAHVEGIDLSRGYHFSHAALALAAASDGQGVVLSLEPLAADDLAAGRLVIPFDLRLPLQQGYFVVCPEPVTDEPKIAVFREWLLQEADQQGAGTESGAAVRTKTQVVSMPVTVKASTLESTKTADSV